MSGSALKVPGVYRQEQTERRASVLSTGVPAFVGFVTATAPVPNGSPQHDRSYGPVVLHRKADFPGGGAKYLDHAVIGFFDNGGDHCYVVGVRVDPADPAAAAELIKALQLLSPLDDVDLIAIPDALAILDIHGVPDESRTLDVQRAMIQHCTAQANRIALLDALQHKDVQTLIESQLKPLGVGGTGPINAAIYHPWIRTIATETQFVPPSGHVAGIIARTDALAGVFKPPANAEIQGATDLDADLDSDSLGALNEAGVNCLRAFPSRGIRVWGARTLSSDPDWRYLNVRRLVLTVARWINLNMTWAAFEPNVPTLWSRIERELSSYLTSLWRAGALQGAAVEDAFNIRCDAELNPPETREVGQVVTEIALAPTVPAEFIVVSVQHRAGTTELI